MFGLASSLSRRTSCVWLSTYLDFMGTMNLFEGYAKIVKTANRFNESGSSKKYCKPFFIDGKQVGLIREDVLMEIKRYPQVFDIENDFYTKDPAEVHLSSELKTFDERSDAIAKVLQEMKEKDIFITLDGWRNECYDVVANFAEAPLLKMERAATCLFGVKQYGVHINGYVNHSAKGLCMWIAKRSMSKETFPGKLDQMVAGGLASGQSIMDCAKKECMEEANVPQELIDQLKPVGTVSYFYEDERGLFPEIQFVMDLVVPEDFEPVNNDGEAESFRLVTIDQVKSLIISEEFKFNCAVVVLDFLVRHSVIKPDDDPIYSQLVQQMHMPLL